jgi:hypothetical protein
MHRENIKLIEKAERKRAHFRNQGMDGKMILKLVLKLWNEGRDWIRLADNRVHWEALVNSAMNIQDI